MSLLTVRGLNQFYGGSHTLWDVDLTVPPDRARASWGATAWARRRCSSASWACCPSASGELVFDGHGPAAAAGRGRARLGIGYVPQGREIFPQLTVEENLRVGLGVRQGGVKDDSAARSSSCFPCSRRC